MWSFRWLFFLFDFCFDGGQGWKLGWWMRLRSWAEAISHRKRGALLYTIELELHPERDMIRFVSCKDWLLHEEGIGAGREWQKTDRLAGLTWVAPFIMRNMERFMAGASVMLAPALKYPCCTLRFLEYVSNVNFILHRYPSVCRSLKCMHMRNPYASRVFGRS